MKDALDILVIDDNPEILKVVELVLRSHGHKPNPTTAENSAALVELKKGHYRPDLILLDILLSGVDGLKLCREWRADPQTKNIPIVMFSAYPNMRHAAQEAGANGFLAKPFSWRDLNIAIKEALTGTTKTKRSKPGKDAKS